MNNDLMFSKKSDMWATPKDFYEKLDSEFHFNLDPCASKSNHKCDRYFTEEDDGLTQNWGSVEYFAIHLIAKLKIGLRNVMKNQESRKQ